MTKDISKILKNFKKCAMYLGMLLMFCVVLFQFTGCDFDTILNETEQSTQVESGDFSDTETPDTETPDTETPDDSQTSDDNSKYATAYEELLDALEGAYDEYKYDYEVEFIEDETVFYTFNGADVTIVFDFSIYLDTDYSFDDLEEVLTAWVDGSFELTFCSYNGSIMTVTWQIIE